MIIEESDDLKVWFIHVHISNDLFEPEVAKTKLATSKENRLSAYAKTKTQISCTVTAQLISAFVFASREVQFLFFLNLKFQVASHFLQLHRRVCVRPGRKPLIFSRRDFKDSASEHSILR